MRYSAPCGDMSSPPPTQAARARLPSSKGGIIVSVPTSHGLEGALVPSPPKTVMARFMPLLSGLNFWTGCTVLILFVFRRLARLLDTNSESTPCSITIAFSTIS